jgi:hypothetical protein
MQFAEIGDLLEGERRVFDSQTAVALGINGASAMAESLESGLC